jgi:protease-4
LIEALREIDEDDRVKAVVLRIDSPGGSGPASDVVYRAVEQTASTKPVIASFGGVAASGGYFIAAGADSIVADASTITGSIGVFSLAVDVSELLNDKLGITFDAVKTAPSADMFSGLRALTAFERRILETGVDRMYDRFTKVVAEGRGLRMTEVLALAEGRAWSGKQASTNGLVDRMGTLDDAIDMAARAAAVDSVGYRIRIYPRERTLLERLWQFASTTESRVLGDAFDGSVTSPAVRQIRLLHELERMHGSVEARMPHSISIE